MQGVFVNMIQMRRTARWAGTWPLTRIAVALLAVALTAGVVPNGRPEDVGLSSERLQRVTQLIQRYIDDPRQP